jgi:hypothetical protein
MADRVGFWKEAKRTSSALVIENRTGRNEDYIGFPCTWRPNKITIASVASRLMKAPHSLRDTFRLKLSGDIPQNGTSTKKSNGA